MTSYRHIEAQAFEGAIGCRVRIDTEISQSSPASSPCHDAMEIGLFEIGCPPKSREISCFARSLGKCG